MKLALCIFALAARADACVDSVGTAPGDGLPGTFDYATCEGWALSDEDAWSYDKAAASPDYSYATADYKDGAGSNEDGFPECSPHDQSYITTCEGAEAAPGPLRTVFGSLLFPTIQGGYYQCEVGGYKFNSLATAQSFGVGYQVYLPADTCNPSGPNYLPGEPCRGMQVIRDFCPSACQACPVSATKDPHLHLAHGGRADLRGEDGGIYSFLSAHNVSMNVQTVKADFHWKEQLVHGTRIGAAYWTLKAMDGSTITIKYESTGESVPKAAHVSVDGKPKATVAANEEFIHQGVHVAHTSAGLKVTNARWTMQAKPAHFPYAKSNQKKYLLDIEITPLYNADADPVAPHGIFGQSFDGDNLAVDGAKDKESEGTRDAAGKVVERTTAAQAEGAIEGSVGDYKMASEFATEFKFSRFNGVPAPHRDVSKLTGHKHTAATTRKGTKATAFAEDASKVVAA